MHPEQGAERYADPAGSHLPKPLRSADRNAGERARKQRDEVDAHQCRVDVVAEPKSGMSEQCWHARNADDGMGEAQPLRAGDAGHQPLPDHHGDCEARDAEGEQQITAPLLPDPVEPETLDHAGAEPVGNGDAGQEQCRSDRRGSDDGERQQQRPVALRLGPGRAHDRALDVRDGAGHLAPDQVHPAQLRDAGVIERPLGKEVRKKVARVRERDQCDIAGIRDVVNERCFDAGPDTSSGAGVESGVANRAECPQRPLLMRLHEAALDETGERLLANRARFASSEFPDPGPRVRRVRSRCDLRKNPVERRVAGRRGIDNYERFKVRVDTPGKSQVQQHGAGERALESRLPGRQVCTRFVVQQQKELFGEGQHALFLPPRRGMVAEAGNRTSM